MLDVPPRRVRPRPSFGVEGNFDSFAQAIGAISDDGRYVVFESDAGNLVPGDVNGHTDVFLRDTMAGTTSLLSVSSSSAQGAAICRNQLDPGPAQHPPAPSPPRGVPSAR